MDMKRIFAVMAAVIVFVGGISAQTRALITLSHDGELTFFSTVSALEDAISASVDGDILYLSEGKFGSSSSSITITDKKISFVGNGYNSHIVPDITFKMTTSGDSLNTLTAPLFDGVRLEKLTFYTEYTNASYLIKNIEVKKSFITTFEVGTHVNDILLDRCRISSYTGNTNKSVCIYNCKIGTFKGAYCEIVENCNIKYISTYSPSYIVNSIVYGFTNNATLGTYENCLIGSTSGQGTGTNANVYRNCYNLTNSETTDILDDDLECTIEDMSEYVGTDGTVVGIYGGQWFPYSETPSVPTVDSSNSSVEYDKTNNQLKVTITVAPN